MHAASKQKFMSCFLNTSDFLQVDRGVQSPWGIYFKDFGHCAHLNSVNFLSLF